MPEEINSKITGEAFEDKWQLIKRINKIVEDSRTTRPGETLKPKGKGPLASLREAMDGIEDDNGRSNEAQQGFYDALGELYTIMKGKGKGQGTWNPNAYGPWKGMKGKGKGKSDDDKECYNCGRQGHIAKNCKAKGKGYEGKEVKGKGKGKDKGYGKGWEDWNAGKGWTGWGKGKGYAKGVYSVHDNYDEDSG